MINNTFLSALSFSRALTTAEIRVLGDAMEKTRKKAEIDYLAMNTPVAAVGAESGKNTGIGNFLGVAKLMNKIAPLTGINTKLLLPTGMASGIFNYSPFSVPAFGLFIGYVDPFKLTGPGYGSLLDPKDKKDKKLLKAVKFHPKNDEEHYRTQYENVQKIEAVLDRAFEKFDPEKHTELSREFDKFKENHKYWLDTYANAKEPQAPERFKFKQFIAEKQYNEMRQCDKTATIVDMPIGNDRELDDLVERQAELFLSGEMASQNDDNSKTGWGVPIPDPGLQKAQEFIKQKAKYHASHGDGVRLDAFQYNMYPIASGNDNLWQYDFNRKAIPDAVMQGFKEAGVKPYLCFAEHLPPKNSSYDVNAVNQYLAVDAQGILGEPLPKLSLKKYPGIYTDEGFWDSYASGHDDPNIHREKNKNPQVIKNEFVDMLGNRPASKFQVMITDVFGCDDEYNVKNTENPRNWRFRLPEDWESLYHRQLQKGYGFNGPEIFADVLKNTKRAKFDEEANKLKAVLRKFSQILKAPGVDTEAKANEEFGANYIDPVVNKILSGPTQEDLKIIEESKAFKMADTALGKVRQDWWEGHKPLEKALKMYKSLSGESENWMRGEQVTCVMPDAGQYQQQYDALQKALGF